MSNVNYKNFVSGVGVVPKSGSDNAVLGDVEVLSSDNKLHFHNGTINDPVVTEAAVATLTNKTLTSPVINTPTGITKSDVGLGNVDNTSDATKNAASVTLTNKTIAAGSNTISGLTNSNLSGSAAVSNANLATMAAHTFKGNNTGSSATPLDLSIAQLQSELSVPTSSSPLALNAGGTGTSAASANAAFNALSPLTTKGDLISFSTVNARLGVGTNGHVLTADSTQTLGIKWAPQGSPTAPLVTEYTSGSGTHTFTGSPLYVRVRLVGGGGGGGGSGSLGTIGTGGTGGDTTVGSSLLLGSGGAGAGQLTGGGGGGASKGSASGIAIQGGNGSGGLYNGPTLTGTVGGSGAASPFGGEGGGAGTNASAGVAIANSGSGGGGASTTDSITGKGGGGGGGAGGFVDAVLSGSVLSGLSGSVSYSIGSGGAGGTNGTSGNSGGAGGSGYVEFTEYYQ